MEVKGEGGGGKVDERGDKGMLIRKGQHRSQWDLVNKQGEQLGREMAERYELMEELYSTTCFLFPSDFIFLSCVISPCVCTFQFFSPLSVIIHCLFQHAFKPELSWLGYSPNLVHNSWLWSTVSCWLPSSQCLRYGSAPQSHLLLTNSCDRFVTSHSLTSRVIVSGVINTWGAVNGSPGCHSFTHCQWFHRVQLQQTLMNLNVSANVLLRYKVNLMSGLYPCNPSLLVCAICLKPDTQCGATQTFSFEVCQLFLSHAAVKKRISKKALQDGYHSLFIKITW